MKFVKMRSVKRRKQQLSSEDAFVVGVGVTLLTGFLIFLEAEYGLLSDLTETYLEMNEKRRTKISCPTCGSLNMSLALCSTTPQALVRRLTKSTSPEVMIALSTHAGVRSIIDRAS